MKKNEVIMLFVEDTTENGLSNIGVRYEILPAYFGNEDPLPLGYALVEVDEGILKVPYYKAETSNGYEQFALEEASLATEAEIQILFGQLESTIQHARDFAQK